MAEQAISHKRPANPFPHCMGWCRFAGLKSFMDRINLSGLLRSNSQ